MTCSSSASATSRSADGFVEYVMLSGINDRVEQAPALAFVLDPRVYKVNLIPYNPTGAYEASSPKAIAAFKDVLDRAGLRATVRLTRGRDIVAACGKSTVAGRPAGNALRSGSPTGERPRRSSARPSSAAGE